MASLLIVGAIAAAFYAAALPRFEAPAQEEKKPEKKLVYMRADRSYSIDVGDSMAVCMVGNFAALHNGAVITCDSAIRYNGQKFECFGNVLINQNTTYIYGDRADYDGRINKAEVYSPLVKVIDGQATLYTRRFVFDTYTQVGEFSRGGVLFNQGNQLESDKGYYYSDTHQVACVGDVEMRDSTYLLKSDSVLYNTDTDYAHFFRNTRIWNVDGDYLEGDEGYYARPEERYVVTKRGYILSEKNEAWSDSLDYFKREERAIMYHNVQLDDTEQMALAFGDYGEYYKNPGAALLTRKPSLISYDTSQGADSLFMRADTIMLLTFYTTQPEFNPWEPKVEVADTTATEQVEEAAPEKEVTTPEESPRTVEATQTDDAQNPPVLKSEQSELQSAPAKGEKSEKTAGNTNEGIKKPQGGRISRAAADSAARKLFAPRDSAQIARELGRGIDSANLNSAEADTVIIDSAALARQRLLDSLDTLSVKAQKAYYKRIDRERKDSIKRVKLAERNEKLQVIARARQAKITAQLNRMDSLEKVRLERRRVKMAARLEAKRQRAIRRGKELPDSTALSLLDSMLVEHNQVDSLTLDSLAVDSMAVDSLALDSVKVDSLPPDTVRRITKGFRNVKIYRSDFQAVCDSLVGIGADSTIHLFIDPVLWNQQNQVSSDVMDIFTKNQAIDHVNFVGSPILVAEIDTMYYNQISGKEMTAWFDGNQVYRHDVNGNVETIYFLQDNPDEPVSSVFIIKSGTASFYLEEQQVVSMTYREQNEYSMMPMDKIPASQELFLKEYKWMPERRPARDSVQIRRIRPSERERKSALPKPRFPLSEQILRQRDNLVDSGNWADRDEVLSHDVIEWVRRNGFEPSQPRKEFR